MGTPDSIINPDRHTLSSRRRVESQLEFRKRIQYEVALMKSTRYRDDLSQINEKDLEHLSEGPFAPTHYGTF